jgi:cell division septation protein DedD
LPRSDAPAKSIAEATAGSAAKSNGQAPAPPPAASTAKPAANDMAARKMAKVAPAAGGSYRVQLGALRSDAEARGAWSRLQKKHADLLGSLALSIDRKDLGGNKGVFFRMQAGPLPSESDARGLCSQLKQRRVDCHIVHL